MRANVVADLDGMPREDWLRLRRQGIGGSDAPAIWGVSPWGSPTSVWIDKTHGVDDDGESEWMRMGRKLEPVIADEFAERHPEFTVVDAKKLFRHPEHHFMLATPDRLLADADGKIVAGLELKNVNAYKAADWAADDEEDLPAHVLLQVLHYGEVLDLPMWVAGLGGGNHLMVKRVPRDPEFGEVLIDTEREFWRLVTDLELPPVDGHAATSAALSTLFGSPTVGSTCELNDEALGALRSLLQANADLKDAEARKEEHANRLKAFLGDNEIGMVGELTAVTWKASKPKRLSQDLLKQNYPDVYEACRVETTQRTLLPKKGEW